MKTLTVDDCKKFDFCVKGQMRFFKAHGIDYREFVKSGVSFERLAGIDDTNLKMAMAQAEARIEAAKHGK